MTNAPENLVTEAFGPEDLVAVALDEAINARQAGQALDRGDLLARHPELADALDALAQLGPLPPADGTISPLGQSQPERIGPYRIERELGAGGFGVVYQAYDSVLKRRVALKLLHPGRLNQPEVVDRFQREACATARLRHPGIVQLCDYSRDGPPHYLATEYVDGVDLRSWSRTQRLSLAEIADLIARVAEAIDHAHALGVYHRDLKPANILVDNSGRPFILDFGLARLYLELETSADAPTSEGRILGTLAYMAPEQAAGRSHQADARSDVYSLGVILYELLTGKLPFEGPAYALPARVIEDDPAPPREINPSIPLDLEAICLKALAKHPDARYRSAAALVRDLRAFLRGEPIVAQRLTWLVRVHKALGRRNRDVFLADWSRLLIFLGLTILAGCAVVNLWQIVELPQWQRGLLIGSSKILQIAFMLVLVARCRPFTGELSMTERQILALVAGYYGGCFALLCVNASLDEPVSVAPFFAVMSGMAFVTLGASVWGWLSLWGLGFFALAALIAWSGTPAGMLLLGLGWCICLVTTSIMLRRAAEA